MGAVGRTWAYTPNQLDRDVVAVDQIRTVIRTFRDRLFTEIFPNRRDVPKTIIFAKDDSHADDIVRIIREEFDKGNDFCQKITYKTTGAKPEDLLTAFPQQLQPPHSRHRGHDRHRHRHQAGRGSLLHAQRPQPQLLRADEGARCADYLSHRLQRRDPRRPQQGPIRDRRRRGA